MLSATDKKIIKKFFPQIRDDVLNQIMKFALSLNLEKLCSYNSDFLYNEFIAGNNFCEDVSQSDFASIIKKIRFFDIDRAAVDHRSNRPRLSAEKYAELMNDQIFETKEQQLYYARCFFCDHCTADQITAMNDVKYLPVSEKSQKKTPAVYSPLSVDERDRKFKEAIQYLEMSTPIDVLCAVYARKKNITFSKDQDGRLQSKPTKKVYSNNDTTIEDTVVYRSYTNEIKKHEGICIIIAPSPYFVQKWLRNPTLDTETVTFVSDENSTLLYRKQYGEALYNGQKENAKNIFICYNEIDLIGEIKGIIVFYNNMLGNKEKIIHWIQNIGSRDIGFVDIFGADEEIIFFSKFIFPQSIVVIKTGISQSSNPKKKMYMRGSTSKNRGKIFMEKLVLLQTNDGHQFLTFDQDKEIWVDYDDFCKNRNELRKFFNHGGKDFIRQRERPKSIRFSNELTIWYSSSQNDDSCRITAYFCEPSESESKRGKMIEGTRKNTWCKTKGDIDNWLIEQYPYASSKSKKNVRSCIAGSYQKYYFEKPISLRTLWYLNEDFEKRLSQSDQKTLLRMIKSGIGDLLPTDDSRDLVLELLLGLKIDHLKGMQILIHLIDFGISKKYYIENSYKLLLTDQRLQAKRQNQVRAALTKKSFTKDEMMRLHRQITHDIDEGCLEAYGLMMRLLTGLEAQIICALEWRDFNKLDRELFVLDIYKEVNNAGNTVKILQKGDEIRSYPCSEKVKALLLRLQENTIVKDDYKNQRIFQFTPYDLIVYGKKVIDRLNIERIIIDLPDEKRGTRQTDLNRYYGDIFKTNFRYWAQYSRLTPDETAYLCGTKRITTYGRYYCDFSNERLQRAIYIKLCRLDALFILQTHDSAKIYNFKEGSNAIYTIKHEYETPCKLTLRLTGKTGQKLRIKVKNQKGFRMSGIQLTKEGGRRNNDSNK